MGRWSVFAPGRGGGDWLVGRALHVLCFDTEDKETVKVDLQGTNKGQLDGDGC